MRRAVWKFRLLEPVSEFRINGFKKVLDVQLQDGVPVLWVIANADEPPVVVGVRMIETGVRFDGVDDEEYIGTVQMPTGSVVHVFVRGGGTYGR